MSFWLSSPITALSISTLFVGSLFIFQIVTPVDPFVSATSLYYCFGGIACMMIAMYLGMRVSFKSRRVLIYDKYFLEGVRINLVYLKIILILASIGFILSMLDIIVSYGANVSIFDFVSIREGLSEREITLLAYPASIFVPFTLFVLGISILFYEEIPGHLRYYGLFVGVASMLLISLAMAGRRDIFNFLIFVYWWTLQRPLLGKKLLPGGACIRVVMISILFFSLSALIIVAAIRSALQESQILGLISFHAKSLHVNSDIIEYLSSVNPVIANAISEAMLYWTHSVVYFDKLYVNWSLNLTFASAFSPFVGRRLAALNLIPSSQEIWQHWSKIMLSYGLYPNAFGTTWSQLIDSFGKIGGLAVAIVVAFVSGYLFVSARVTMDFRNLFISSILFLFLFLWFQGSVFGYSNFEMAMYIALFLSGFWRKLVRKSYTLKCVPENKSSRS